MITTNNMIVVITGPAPKPKPPSRSCSGATYLRGNKAIATPLKFVRFEPYVIPKVSLTGEPTERVDTKVMQVIYSFRSGDLSIKPGQQMDVYIDAQPVAANPPDLAKSLK